ncbi:MAG: glycosyltransferase family 9 protein [Bdellovibrionales bacterium]|nr:glycosyltransferase family 9 protein [Bdellovibrionales bacterium]
MAAERILVIQTAFLGDVVLTTPFLRQLRLLEPRAEITLLTTPAGARLLTPSPWPLRVLSYDKRGRERGFRGFGRQAWGLRRERFDLVFCLHRSVRSALLARSTGSREVWGFRESPAAALYHRAVGRAQGAFEAEKNLELLTRKYGASFSLEDKLPELHVSDEDEASAARLLGGLAGPFAVMAPSSVWATKRWPAERFGALAARLSGRIPTVILAGGDPEELALAREVADRGGGLNLAGKTSLGEMKAILRRASFAVTNDSAPLHMAIALGCPGVAIFGPTVRSQGFFPLAPAGRWITVEREGLECRPCGPHGHTACPRGHFDCMRGLEVEEVFRAVEKLPWRNG